MINKQTDSHKGDILIVDDDLASFRTLSSMLTAEGYEVRGVPDGPMALTVVENNPPELILLDIKMPGMDGFEVCQQIKADEKSSDIPILFLSALDELEDKLKGFSIGAADFMTKPFQAEEVLARVDIHIKFSRLRRNLEEQVVERTAEIKKLKDRIEQENIYLRKEIEVKHKHEEIIGNCEPVRKMLSEAEQVAKTDSTVLILGETGTGKELLARAIHNLSLRKDRQMVTLNCAALPPTLLESELFGREKGAYTGAMTRQIGRFEFADGSSIFLDEIGEMPLEVQTKFLRVLQERQFERLGNPQTISVNVRIIASTNRDLARAVVEGRFREDLYYRLNVFSVNVPPLRDRMEDIPSLVWAFTKEFEKSMGKAIEKIPQKSIDALQQYQWPGNIRELRNVVENAMIISKDRILKLKSPVDLSLNLQRDLKLEVVERNHIIDVLDKTSWRVSGQKGAANLLGLKPTTLESKIKKMGITRPK
ncbi:MAG: sigma-54-dependent Fis family transcriptional regulator [Desulfobulbaceae bacterium]|nr:sigma-54-dependent Fis family transcriptional regulator [Desulfobulbaceae bacterium]